MWRLIIVFMLACGSVQAGEWSLQVYQLSRIADDDSYQAGSWNGIQLSYGSGDKYYFISQDVAGVYPIAHAFDYKFTTVGIGIKKKITSGINLFGQVGATKIDDTLGEKHYGDIEALTYYFNERIGQQLPAGYHQAFDSFGVKHDDYVPTVMFGGEIYTNITDNTVVSFNFSYRSLKFHESLAAYRNDWDAHNATLSPGQTPTYWEFGVGRNYSSFNTGITISYSF